MQFLSRKPLLSGKTVISQFLNQRSLRFQSFNRSSIQPYIRVFHPCHHAKFSGKGKSLSPRCRHFHLGKCCNFMISQRLVPQVEWSDWPGIAIFSVPGDRKENATAWKIRKFHEHNDTCVISRRRNSRKDKISFNHRRLHMNSMVFCEPAGSVKKGIVIFNDPILFIHRILFCDFS